MENFFVEISVTYTRYFSILGNLRVTLSMTKVKVRVDLVLFRTDNYFLNILNIIFKTLIV